MVLGMSPLVTSALRLVVIATLFAANLASLCRTYKHPKYSGLLSFQRVTILTILMLNLLYLSVIWAPFTITTFKHNLQDRRLEGVDQVDATSPSIMDHLIRQSKNVYPETQLDRTMEESPLGQYILAENNYYPRQAVSARFQSRSSDSDLGESLSRWITHVQDLVISSFTYSLILTILVEKIMVERGLVVGPLRAALSALLLAVTPLPLILAVRGLASTTDLFALHTPEVRSGYTMYSIICDVYITETYVVGLFLELTLVLLLVAALLVVTRRRCSYCSEEESKSCLQEEDDSFQVEDVACKFVLLTSAGWAWPVKPLLVIVLYCISGPHWNNAVCWLANMVVAIPVSFMPLAVFLARPKEANTCSNYAVSDGAAGAEATEEEHNVQSSTESDASSQCASSQDVVLSPASDSMTVADTHKDALGKKSQIRENLKFYLGTDIFKNKGKKEDEVCILTNQDGHESPV